MTIKYKKTFENYVFALLMQNIVTSLFLLFGAIGIAVLETGGFNLVKIVQSKQSILIVIAIIIILIEVARAYFIAIEERKKTGGLYGDYLLELNEESLKITYEEQTKTILWEDVKSIKIDNSFIMVNFGDKDILITISKYFLNNSSEYKALKKYFLRKKRNMVKNLLFK